MVLPLAHAHANVSLVPVRKEPDHRSEQVNQVLFGERVIIRDVNNKGWALMRSCIDDYEGWCRIGQLTAENAKEYRKPTRYLCQSNNGRLLLPDGEMWIPAGSELRFSGGKLNAGQESGKFRGKKLKVRDQRPDAQQIRKAALSFLYAPYQWGGRSVAGIDCSGLTQMAFRLCNLALPRDASQQAAEGLLVDFLQHAQCGDLAFFDNDEGKIVHVGLLLDNETIVHATETTGRAVIDKIDQEGIVSRSLKKRTHHLRMVKRLIGS